AGVGFARHLGLRAVRLSVPRSLASAPARSRTSALGSRRTLSIGRSRAYGRAGLVTKSGLRVRESRFARKNLSSRELTPESSPRVWESRLRRKHSCSRHLSQ